MVIEGRDIRNLKIAITIAAASLGWCKNVDKKPDSHHRQQFCVTIVFLLQLNMISV